MKIISACLVGINCKWDGKNKCIPKLREQFLKGELLPLCAEQLGGLSTPRAPSGILGGTGKEVITGECKVINSNKEDVTKQFLKGAYKILDIAKVMGIKEAILKKTSPACGVGKTWKMSEVKGELSNTLVEGDGVLTALLRKNGITVSSEQDL